MGGNLASALLITVAGMGLVFAAILLFWAFMSLLVRFTSVRTPAEAAAQPEEAAVGQGASARELKRRAALVAVAVALAQQSEEGPKPFPMPPTALVSTWQAVMRSKLLGERGSVR